MLKVLFEKEAVVLGQLITTLVALLAGFGVLDWTAEQTGQVIAVTTVFGVILSRYFVWSEESVQILKEEMHRFDEDGG